jgi:LmbE family N-acetylglucosaminyl deacetylase
LDDVVFSCGGWLTTKVEGLRPEVAKVHCLTIFTATVSPLSDFAKACRYDKGLDDKIDYMALRRAEDREACRILGIEPVHWDFAEAPHRGYTSAADLFGGIHGDDPLEIELLKGRIGEYVSGHYITEVVYPFGAGNHVDHLQLIRAVEGVKGEFPDITFRQYYDMPYAVKFRERYPELGTSVKGYPLSEEALVRKLRACAAYASQVGFQFGDAERMGEVLGREEFMVVRW